MFKIRRILFVLIIGASIWFGGPYMFKGIVLGKVNATFARFGFNDPRYDVEELGWFGLKLANVQLEPEGISTIESIEVSYSPVDLMRGHAKKIVISTPDIIQDDENNSPNGLAALPDLLNNFSLQHIPAQTLDINHLSISYASDDFNPSVQGTINLLTNGDGTKKLTFAFESEQKDLVLSGNGNMTEDTKGAQSLNIQIPEAKIDIPGLRLSRANAKFAFSRVGSGPLSIQGELAAGGFKIGTLLLDDLTVVATGRKPDLSIIGNATVTGIPMTNFSLRLAEDAKGASLLLQLSGESPKWMYEQLFPGTKLRLPEQQKYAIAIDLKDPSLLALLKTPYTGGVFVYLDDPSPILGIGMACQDLRGTCKFNLPATALPPVQAKALFGQAFANHDITLTAGDLKLAGVASSERAEDNNLKLTSNYELSGDALAGTWHGVKFTEAGFESAHKNDGTTIIANTSAKLFKGRVRVDKIALAANGNGTGQAQLSDLDLESLQKVANIPGLTISGKLSGTLPVTFEEGLVHFQAGSVLSSTAGRIQYVPNEYPSFLSGADQRLDILREALKDYTYQDLKLAFTGPINDRIDGKLTASGKNTGLFGDRALMLDLLINTLIASGLQKMAPNFTPTVD